MESFKDSYKKLLYEQKIHEKAKKELFDNIFILKLKGDNKLQEIDDYNQEDILKLKNGGIPVSGLIYTFLYSGEFIKNENKYKTKFPIILCTNINGETLEGIDLMLMREEIRVLFLEIYYKLFESIFAKIEEKTENKILVLNDNFIRIVKSGKLRIFFDEIYKITKIDISTCYRKYKLSNIKELRMLEINKWKYIPFYKNVNNLEGISYDKLYK